VQSLTALVADLEYFRARYLPHHEEESDHITEKVETWQELARESLTSMRQALGALRATNDLASCQDDLPRAIEGLLARMQGAGFRVEFECDNFPAILPDEYTSNLYSIVREALTNISKHAHASTISVFLFCFESRLFLSIADDGVGIVQNASSGRHGNGYHQGLIGMRERAAMLGGRMTLESIPSRGTRIDIDIPLPGALPGCDTYRANRGVE
jgi:signal transduction histidine kinase